MNSCTKTIRVLSLDGGGVRGLSSMIILEHVIDLVKKQLAASQIRYNERELLPSELFDHIVGTSTGGLIAVMLVKLNMPISECIQVYKKLIPRIFARRQFGSCFGGLGVPRYSHQNFQKCIQEVFEEFGRRSNGETIRFMEEGNIGNNESFCTVVCRELNSSGRRMHHPAFICSHYCRSSQQEAGRSTPYELWMTCRATTAAPTFFSSMKIHGRTFVDGAFGNTNNPTRKAHFHFLSRVSGYKDCPVIWLNIGTGSPKPQHDNVSARSRRSSSATAYKRSWKDKLIPRAIREAQNLLCDLEAIATDSDRVEEEMEDIINSKSNEQSIVFARISANNGVADIQLDDWRALEKIERLTRAYLLRPHVQLKLQGMAMHLAEEMLRRQDRSDGTQAVTIDIAPPISLSLLHAVHDDINPLPSPTARIFQSAQEFRNSANSQGSSPSEKSPVSPLTTNIIKCHDEEPENVLNSPSTACPSRKEEDSPTILPTEDKSDSAIMSKSLAPAHAPQGSSALDEQSQKRFLQLNLSGNKGEEDESWKRRRTAVF